jgi:hypothetical protein
MKHRYSYFQFDGDLSKARLSIEAALGLVLSERESSYWGGTYFQFKDNKADFRLKLHRNVDHTGEWIIKEFEGATILCCLDGPVEVVDTFSAKVQTSDGQLLTTRIQEIDGN